MLDDGDSMDLANITRVCKVKNGEDEDHDAADVRKGEEQRGGQKQNQEKEQQNQNQNQNQSQKRKRSRSKRIRIGMSIIHEDDNHKNKNAAATGNGGGGDINAGRRQQGEKSSSLMQSQRRRLVLGGDDGRKFVIQSTNRPPLCFRAKSSEDCDRWVRAIQLQLDLRRRNPEKEMETERKTETETAKETNSKSPVPKKNRRMSTTTTSPRGDDAGGKNTFDALDDTLKEDLDSVLVPKRKKQTIGSTGLKCSILISDDENDEFFPRRSSSRTDIHMMEDLWRGEQTTARRRESGVYSDQFRI